MDPGFLFITPTFVTLGFFAREARNLWLKDRFLERLYTDHRDIWESLGSPRGWQWRPPERIPTAFATMPWVWSRTDPNWLERTPELRDPFRRVRSGVREWNFRAMPLMIALWVLFGTIVTYLQRRQ
jgi:hypothetical protein